MIDKNYFLTRLANGEDMDAIGNELAAMMTDALNEYNDIQEAKAIAAAEAEKALAKRDLVAEMMDIVAELAILEGVDPDDIVITDEAIDDMVDLLSAMFQDAKETKELIAALAAKEQARPASVRIAAKPVVSASDDEIIANFLASLTQ